MLWAFALPALAQPTRVAAIGDSITFGAGIDNPDETYPNQLQSLLGGDYDVRNFGRSGADVLSVNNGPYVNTQEHQEALAFLPNVVVSNLGINDSGLFIDNQQAFVDDYVSLLSQYASLPSGPTIYLWTQLAPVYSGNANFELINSQRHLVNARLTEIAISLGAQGIDMYSPLENHPEWFPDSLHPNAAGAAVIAAVTHATLTSPPWNGIAGDVNQDGTFLGDGTGPVESDDVAAFIAGWGSTGLVGAFNQYTAGDLNFDGATTLADAFAMHRLLEAQGNQFPFRLLAGVSVPEPRLRVMTLALFITTWRRRELAI